MELAAILFCLFFAMNIGASGAAASMGVAYGSGAVKKKTYALIICAAGVLSGAVIGGGEVVKTISGGIIPEQTITLTIVCIIIGSAALSLFTANVLGIPLSTSEVTVGAIVGVGVAYKVLFLQHLLVIVSFWVLVPFVAFCFTFLVSKVFSSLNIRVISNRKQKILGIVLLIAGFWEAFSAGMNNVANAVGPLVAAGVLSVSKGTLYGGIFVALGALLLGRKVLETNGKKITRFSAGEGILLSGTGAGLVIISSVFGLPVPLAQVTSSSIIGIGMAKNGPNVFHKEVVKTMLKVWVVSPFLSLSISYLLVSLLLKRDYYSIFMMASVLLAAGGAASLMKAIRKEKRSVHEQGGGI
ncbi:inorganic phosphate transporter [Bacillus velezensis]|uniref:inorganic phosphate transporter n=1 Tax=Bacillus velezensis TaxID=492670 RepID=UPI000E23887A|nr:inorganic phosphate transporter [Bacillus velezensis]QHQ58742.1 inorganic phosphate transporter [Bacillus velezensis]RDY85890.1 anion permease [Bacillus velezensis]